MIAIVDYGMGNLRSVAKALQRAGGDVRIVQTPSQLAGAEKVVLPGVGAFGQAMDRLRSRRLAVPLVRAADSGTPFLGICLGLQLLFDVSYEAAEHTGLGILAGKVVRFVFDPKVTGQDLSVPHMGWNSLHWSSRCPLFHGLNSGAYAYFAHSYYVVPLDSDVTCTATEYGYWFTSSIWRGNVFAVQFHPEKSQAVGLTMLENFVKL